MKLRKINRAIHRDLGYFFTIMCIIYGLSGIALNHMEDWNPSYKVISKNFQLSLAEVRSVTSKQKATEILQKNDIDTKVKKVHSLDENTIKLFIPGGSVEINKETGDSYYEVLKKRPLFFRINTLHYNNVAKVWTWFSDLFAISLIILAISGLFILKGKNGFVKRGMWFFILGLTVPIVFIIFFIG